MYFKPWRNARSFYYLRGMFLRYMYRTIHNTCRTNIFFHLLYQCVYAIMRQKYVKSLFFPYIFHWNQISFLEKLLLLFFLSDFEEIYIDFSRFDLHLLIYMYIKINFWPLIWKVNTSSTTLKYCFRSPLYILCKN